jgi:hypothetical protein
MKLLEDLSSSDSGCSAACLASAATELLLARGDTVAATLLRWPATRSILGEGRPAAGVHLADPVLRVDQQRRGHCRPGWRRRTPA